MLTWEAAYTPTELEDAQARWNIQFPPDLIALFLEHRPAFPEKGRIDWVHTDASIIEKRLNWPLEGFWFDVVNSDVWWPEWGERPNSQEEQREVLKSVFAKAPTLVPIFSHRYIPSETNEEGNPVFSVYQTDVIYYGADVMDYLERELGGGDSEPWPAELKEIPFWSLAEQRNG